MKLEKFKKNKTYKKTLLALGIATMCLGGGIILSKSYALYETKKEYNVIRGVVPYFTKKNSDNITLLAMINGKEVNYFPEKATYSRVDVTCDNEADGTWDTDKWGIIVTNLKQSPTVCKVDFIIESGATIEYDYAGNEQEFIVPIDGVYQIELWGAQGGSNKATGGLGGYTSGKIKLDQGKVLYVYVGGAGGTSLVGVDQSVAGGYNGGGYIDTIGKISSTDRQYASGGGATDIRLTNGNWDKFESLKSRIMVAAGGGGAYSGEGYIDDGGAGGGLSGINGNQHQYGGSSRTYCYGEGATQISSGNFTKNCGQYSTMEQVLTSGFGYGGGYQSGIKNPVTGGGGGYYGGGRSGHIASGGGGSSFISGHEGCDAIKEISTATNIQHTGKSIHYSGLYFTETKMVDGDGYDWTAIKGEQTNMPTHDGSDDTMVGNSGNGYAKITYLGSE